MNLKFQDYVTLENKYYPELQASGHFIHYTIDEESDVFYTIYLESPRITVNYPESRWKVIGIHQKGCLG